MKRDYYFKNPMGCRMFSLDLDDFQLALISSDHEVLDAVEEEHGKNTGKMLAFELLEAVRKKRLGLGLDAKGLGYEKYMDMLAGQPAA